MRINLKGPSIVAALKSNLVPNHQIIRVAMEHQLISACQYKFDPFNDLNCFFKEIKYGTASSLFKYFALYLILLKKILSSKLQNRGNILTEIVAQFRFAEYVDTFANQILAGLFI